MERKESKIIIDFLERQLELEQFTEEEKKGYLICLQKLKDNCPTESEYKIYHQNCKSCNAPFDLTKIEKYKFEREKTIAFDYHMHSTFYYRWILKCPKCGEDTHAFDEIPYIDFHNMVEENIIL